LLKVVLDTNVLLVSVSSRSKLHWIFEDLINGKYTICVTTEILNEYAEIIENHMGAIASESLLGVLENLPNIELITTYFRFGLLSDPDDNKFVDCAIACNADYIVTHDKDFNKLNNISFPKINLANTESFKKIIVGQR